MDFFEWKISPEIKPPLPTPETKFKKVVKAEWSRNYSCLVVDGKQYRISEEQRKKLEKNTPYKVRFQVFNLNITRFMFQTAS